MLPSDQNSQPSQKGDVTRLLAQVRKGDTKARDEVYNIVYEQLVLIAGRQIAKSNNPTISGHDLVHESFEKLIPSLDREFENRSHFYGVAARAMRQIVIDYARRKSAAKRGGDRHRVTLSGIGADRTLDIDDLISLNDAVARLGELNPRLQQVVELRFFVGLDEVSIAETLGVSTRTVERDWTKARMFLHRELYPDADA